MPFLFLKALIIYISLAIHSYCIGWLDSLSIILRAYLLWIFKWVKKSGLSNSTLYTLAWEPWPSFFNLLNKSPSNFITEFLPSWEITLPRPWSKWTYLGLEKGSEGFVITKSSLNDDLIIYIPITLLLVCLVLFEKFSSSCSFFLYWIS